MFRFKISSMMITAVLMMALQHTGFAQQDTMNRFDKQGKRHGYWMKYSGDTLMYEGRFENGAPSGIFVYYHPNKKVKSTVLYSEKGKVARSVMFHENGAIMAAGKYVDQKKDSVWRYYSEYDLLVSTEEYVKGVPQGVWRKYNPKGDVIEEVHYKDGKKNGDWIQYFDGGKVKLKGIYKDDLLNGAFLMYYANGMFAVSGKYEKSLPAGTWVYYTIKGEVERKDTYKDGRKIKTEQLIPVVEPDSPEAIREVNNFRRQLRNMGLE